MGEDYAKEENKSEKGQDESTRKLRITTQVKQANRYIDKFLTLQTEFQASLRLPPGASGMKKHDLISMRQTMKPQQSCSTVSVATAQKTWNLETQIKEQEKKDSKKMGASNIMELLKRPESLADPDYPKLALQATKRETQTLQYELNHVVDKQEVIIELEA